MKKILTFIFGILMILGGIMHFIKPSFYFALIPDFLPKLSVVYLSGVLELLVGVMALSSKYRSLGTLGIFLMMLAFLPVHTWDVFRENPAMGSHGAALVRLSFQFVLIGWAWYIHKK